jgi:hypothetical protein
MGRNDERPGKERVAQFQTRTVECEVVSIDDYLRDVQDVSLVKCDIEGADLFAMRGARKLLERHRPTVIIEITPWYLEGFGQKVTDVTEFFDALGYRCYRYVDAQLRPATADIIEEDNWVFIHPSRAARFAQMLPASG